MKATTIVDNKALDEGIFKSQLGAIKHSNKLFEPSITDVLAQFNRSLRQQSAWLNVYLLVHEPNKDYYSAHIVSQI